MRLDNHVADIDADTETKTPVFSVSDCKLTNTGLELHSSANRFDRASDDRHRSIGSQGLPAARGSITGALIEPIPAPQLNGKAHAVCHSKLSAKIVSGEITQSGELNPLKGRPKAL